MPGIGNSPVRALDAVGRAVAQCYCPVVWIFGRIHPGVSHRGSFRA